MHRITCIGQPMHNLNTLKGKIYYELISQIVNKGKKYVPSFFLRGMGAYLLNNNYKDMVGVEIGTAGGQNALSLLSCLDIKKLFCIDPYPDSWNDGWNKTRVKGSKQKAEFLLKRFRDKIIFVKEFSDRAIDAIPGGLDFVYIDGGHEYEQVKKDIDLYYPKIRNGGVLGGHDFGGFVGVVNAVQEFASGYDYNIFLGRDGDWWIVKS